MVAALLAVSAVACERDCRFAAEERTSAAAHDAKKVPLEAPRYLSSPEALRARRFASGASFTITISEGVCAEDPPAGMDRLGDVRTLSGCSRFRPLVSCGL